MTPNAASAWLRKVRSTCARAVILDGFWSTALLGLATLLGVAHQAPAQVSYAEEVRPLFAAYCYECHGADRAAREADLRLDEKASAFADRSFYQLIVPGKPEASEVYQRVASEFAEDRMPPYTSGRELSSEQIDLIRRWIAEGADWPENITTSLTDAAPQPAWRGSRSGVPVVEVPRDPFVIHTHEIAEVRVVPLVRGLSHPWSVAFLPKGDLLITERGGDLRMVRDGVLMPQPITGVPRDVLARGLSGMMEVALHPEFEHNRLVYLTYTRQVDRVTGTVALVRGRLEGTTLHDVEDVFVAEPWLKQDWSGDEPNARLSSTAAARLAFAPDGKLFMTMGGAFGAEREDGTSSFLGKALLAQDLSSHAGKLLRLNDDGTAPHDNPFTTRPGAKPQIYSLGHRNQQGLALHPQTGQPFAVEHGPQGGDELNAIEAGANYGWPVVSYGRHYDGPRIAKQLWRDGMKEPLVLWVPSVAPSGLAFYSGEAFPEWRGNLFVGALMEGRIPRTGHLERIVFNERGEEVRRESLLTDLRQRVRDVRQGPDGLLYVLTEESDAALLRLEPVQAR